MTPTTNETEKRGADSLHRVLGERLLLVVKLRESGKKTFKEIGADIGCGAQRARQLYCQAKWRRDEWPKEWWCGLSVRAANCLNNCNINSRAEALEAYQSGRLRPLKYPRNYGWKSHKEIALWLGLPEPKKPSPRIYAPKTCPHCGGKLA